MEIPNEPIALPVLYKLDSQGKVRCWRTWSVLNDDGTATEMNESGLQGGSLTGIPIIVTSGKNIGKKNETTPLQQANRRIAKKYEDKLVKGYVQDLSEFQQSGVMAAMNFRVSHHRMSAIALKQPKIDGIRCKVENLDKGFRMMSKHNKEFKDFLYTTPWAQYLRASMGGGGEVDGEMYIHGLELNEIASLHASYKPTTEEFLRLCEDTPEGLRITAKKKVIMDQVYRGNFAPEDSWFNKPEVMLDGTEYSDTYLATGGANSWTFEGYTTEDISIYGTNDLEFWAFDIPDETSDAETRNQNLKEFLDNEDAVSNQVRALVAEEFAIVDIKEVNEEYVGLGFEGTMIRRPSGLYSYGNRSPDLQKYKLFYDAEWTVRDFTTDRQGNPNFVFESDTGERFESRPTGNRAWRLKILRDKDIIIGLRATVQYQKLYTDTLVPQFGRVIAIRDYE